MKKLKTIESEKIDSWVQLYKTANARTTKRLRLENFLRWFKKSPEDFLKLSPKELKHSLLNFQSHELAKTPPTPNNSILCYISSAKNFWEYENDLTIKFTRGQLVSAQKANGFHEFSNGDLRAMFEIANVQYKALIAVATSTGWSISDILALKKDFIASLIKRAEENSEKFIFWKDQRIKTNSESLGILNPFAIEWLKKYTSQIPKEEKLLFPLTRDGVSKSIKKLAKRSQITTTGKIRFHKIRAWVMQRLTKAGFSTWEVKYAVGKKIPLSDETYLNLAEDIKEKYPTKYEDYLCIVNNTSIKKTSAKMQKFEKMIGEQKHTIDGLRKVVDISHPKEIKKIEETLTRQNDVIVKLVRTVQTLKKQLKQFDSIYYPERFKTVAKKYRESEKKP